MAATYVSVASANGTSLSMPTHAAGDLLIFAAYGRTATPTTPSGWIDRSVTGAATTGFLTISWRNAASGAETSGTWTNAHQVICAVYRSNSGLVLSVGAIGVNSGNGVANVNYNTISGTAWVRASNGWAVGVAGSLADDVVNTAPSGMTNRTSTVSTSELGLHDSNGALSSWSSTNVATTSVQYRSVVLEIFETTQAVSSGSGGVPLIGHGGLVY
jgi:hypothetical protein